MESRTILQRRERCFKNRARRHNQSRHRSGDPRDPAGDKGEREAAYEIDFHHGPSRNWAVIHDLRIEHEGRFAQIDHLLIGRFLDVWVCETKQFSQGVSINEHGEFTRFYDRRPVAIASPLEQNRKHLLVLDRVLQSDAWFTPL